MTEHAIDLKRLDKGELIALVGELASSGGLTARVLARARWRAAEVCAERLGEAASEAVNEYLAACELEKKAAESGRPTTKLMTTCLDKRLAMHRTARSAQEADARVQRLWKALRDFDQGGAR